jgi:hypothetical protein
MAGARPHPDPARPHPDPAPTRDHDRDQMKAYAASPP